MKLTMTKVSIPVLMMMIQSADGTGIWGLDNHSYMLERQTKPLHEIIEDVKESLKTDSNRKSLYITDKEQVPEEILKILQGDDTKTDQDKIRDAVAAYISGYWPSNPITGLSPNEDKKLEKIAEYLVGKGTDDVYSSDVIKYVKDMFYKDDPDFSTNLSYDHLEALKKCLDAQDMKPSGNLKRTTKENVGEYLKDHEISSHPTNEALCEVIALLNEKADEAGDVPEVKVTTDDVKSKVEFTFKELCDFIEYMQKEGVKEVSEKIKVEMTDAERIRVEVDEYYSATDPHTVGDLDIDQAYDLAIYMRGLDTETTITSDITKTDTVPSIKGKTITYQNLVDLVGHLNTKEAVAGK
ncbi:MAG: hypothetical protein J6P84_01830, partial [Alphaproteobacteria bacterium]|nr:hypothetical protein [Alphaproteobacteria bacterium]